MSATSAASTVAAFRRAVESADSDAVLATRADEVTFDNPSRTRRMWAYVCPDVQWR